MHIGLVSYHPVRPDGMQASTSELLSLYRYASSLVAHGWHVLWLCPPVTLDVLTAELTGAPVRPSVLPGTCRYVVPCRAYTLAGVELFCPDEELWKQRPFHTRLFTLICLLQQTLSCDLWHAWGSFPAPYLTVYAARFLDCPVVVTCEPALLQSVAQHAFEWQWVCRHAALLLVEREADQERLIHDASVPDTTPVQCVPRDGLDTASIVRTWYQQRQRG